MLHGLGVNWVFNYPLKCFELLQNWPQNHKSFRIGSITQTSPLSTRHTIDNITNNTILIYFLAAFILGPNMFICFQVRREWSLCDRCRSVSR